MKRNIKNYTEFLFENTNPSQEEFFGVTKDEFGKLLKFEEDAAEFLENIREKYDEIRKLKSNGMDKDNIQGRIMSARIGINTERGKMEESLGNIEPTTEQGKSLVSKALHFFTTISYLIKNYIDDESKYAANDKLSSDIRYHIPNIEKALEDYKIAIRSYPIV